MIRKNFGKILLSLCFFGSPLLALADDSDDGSVLVSAAAQSPVGGIRFFARGEDSLAARLAAIRSAQTSVDLFTYLLEPCDSSGKLLLNALVERARHGVAVRLLLNSSTMQARRTQLPGLAAYVQRVNSGLKTPIELRLYDHPGHGFPLNPLQLNNHSHIKLLLIDAKGARPALFVGGRNSADGYFGLSSELNYFDQDLLVTYPKTAREALSGIETALANAVLSTPAAADSSGEFEGQCLQMSARDAAVEKAIVARAKELPADSRVYACPKVSLAIDDPMYHAAGLSSPVGDDHLGNDRLRYKHSTSMVLDFLDHVGSTLVGANQYYIPVAKLRTSLDRLRDSGRNVTIFTNATGDIDVAGRRMNALIADAIQHDTVKNMKVVGLSSQGALRDEGDLSMKGARWRIHTKTAVRDHKDVLVSSFNFDSRSYQINAEDALVVEDCPELAAAMERDYQVFTSVQRADQKCGNCRTESAELKGLLPLSPRVGAFDFFY